MSAEMDALVGRVANSLEALEAALYGFKQVRGTFTSPDRSITVEVDGDGAVTSLRLAESVTAQQPSEVSQLILWACQQAAADATAQRAQVMAELNKSLPRSGTLIQPTGNVGGGPDSARGSH
ncbi:YbaB/EbfC family nucleoid-associated protein [Nocardia huaxiensis]|uniref:YbaB/EbfC family nucleoid-associated protein n=1 Tax=Nocardia huaxiensis TaxID=2755382 RepID=A0A7D6VFX1_9NOCA|nr:YbaB/EbfC family nucleoid-associated protein [Nocardia huaxiensis]QLY32017.1 YbaB/EbfC family nucleoid-associated protein [Nocardia huaxiensis]UFS95591.1 YbaB/EbfC family nucleoid-associated protein [Nocardia huaxiensis]